ncbi:TPA: hypothetical protein N0F65_002210 [Lagenidium giganteum]|uniref:CAP-Gly domain-containing protein n=1 Tax=Lagenidium giganteum TaxID=4803 RepID=A0AAV2YTJ0_9STRA|nr:TPA: hypothetical protein N0F65_002210 [Lagenidium giganteum]
MALRSESGARTSSRDGFVHCLGRDASGGGSSARASRSDMMSMISGIPKPRSPSMVNTNSTYIRVPVDSRVVLSGRRYGFVRYAGKLKNELGEWYGIELDEPKGEHDGTWEKERYFDCAPHHGTFVRRKEIFYVKEVPVRVRSPPSPVNKDGSEDGDGSTISSADSSQDTVQAPILITPLVRTFKSFKRNSTTQAKAASDGSSIPAPQPSVLSDTTSPATSPKDIDVAEVVVQPDIATPVESMDSGSRGERDEQPTPLFLKRANIGSNIERRASAGSMLMSTNLGATAATARMLELEKEISLMKTNHENIVAVLRATNKQHAANVLELRAQVSALTEANNWLDKQLSAKNALITELRQFEKQDRISRSEVEKIIALKDQQIHTLEKEIAKLKQQMIRIETEKDSMLIQLQRHHRARQERDQHRISKLREDFLDMVSVMQQIRHCNERVTLQSELQDLKDLTFLF